MSSRAAGGFPGDAAVVAGEAVAALDKPLVSVLVPVYNAERYLARCLDSILGQTYGNVEVVAIDDGSRDGSPALLDEYAARFGSLVLVEHRANGGAAAARNRAIELAHGEYLAFADNDDWLDPDFVERLMGVALKTGAEVVCSGYRRPDSQGKVLLEAVPQPGDEWGRYVVEAAWAKLYHTDYVRGHGFTFLDTNIDEDLYFSLPAIELARHVEVVPYCGYNWFYNTESVSNTSQRSSEGLRFEETLDAILAMMGERGVVMTDILRHYFVRLVAWFLLYTCRGDGAGRSRENLAHYVAWLDRNIADWRREPFARVGHPTGDAAANQLAVWLFARHPRLFALALAGYRRVGGR